jgi:hypothetical protein
VSVSQILTRATRTRSPTGAFLQGAGYFFVKVTRHILGRGVDAIERRDLVEHAVIEPFDHIPQPAFQLDEVHEQSGLVQLFAFQSYFYLVIVPVYVFALAAVAAQGVAGGEAFLDGNFKHRKTSPRLSGWW